MLSSYSQDLLEQSVQMSEYEFLWEISAIELRV